MKKPEHLPLLSLLPAQHAIFTEPVPEGLALRPGLVTIVITRTRGDEVLKRSLPIQWSPQEAGVLIHEIRGVSWQLDDDGWSIDYLEIHEIYKQFLRS